MFCMFRVFRLRFGQGRAQIHVALAFVEPGSIITSFEELSGRVCYPTSQKLSQPPSTEVTPRAQKLSQRRFPETTAIFLSYDFKTISDFRPTYLRDCLFPAPSTYPKKHLQLLVPPRRAQVQLDYREPSPPHLPEGMFQGPLAEAKKIFERWARRREL